MQVALDCPKCDAVTRIEFTDDTPSLSCEHCEHSWAVPDGAVQDGTITRCLVCPSSELYVRKDFSQKLGVGLIVAGLALSCIPWWYGMWYTTYGILFATAIIDAVLYMLCGNVLQCYRCHSQYRGMQGLEAHSGFDLEVHEKHRQQVIRMNEAERDRKWAEDHAETKV